MKTNSDKTHASENYTLQNNNLRREGGIGVIGGLFTIICLAAVVYFSLQVVPVIYSYFDLIGEMKSLASKAHKYTDKEIRENIFQNIKDLGIPIEKADDIKIERTKERITIDCDYSEPVVLDLGGARVYQLYNFEFNPHVEAVL